MNSNVSWIFELTLTSSTSELKSLMAELIDSTKKEPKSIMYDWYLSDDGKICHIHEKYADSEAALVHLATFTGSFAARLMSLGNATGFVVYGDPSKELRKALESFGGRYMSQIGSL